MGLIKGVLKFILSNLFVLFLLLFVLTAALHNSLSPDYFKGQVKSFLKEQPGFSENIEKTYNYSRLYFFVMNQTKDVEPKGMDMPFKFIITKQDANLSKEEFEDAILEKFADEMYTSKQDTPIGKMSLGKMSIASLGEKAGSYKRMSMILSILSGLALFVLFSGRFVLVGINFIVVAVFYFPTKFLFSTLQKQAASNVPGEVAASFQNLLGGIFSNSLSIASRYFFYFFIAGIAFVLVGFLIKILKIGLWFQSFFEKKEIKKRG